MSSVHALSTQADYACGHAGACCSSGWPIPVEHAVAQSMTAALAARRLSVVGLTREPDWLSRAGTMPDGVAGVLPCGPDGTCVFHDRDGRRCRVHGELGLDALPLSCRQFPRIVLVDPRGTFVTLSHYCPTAAARLFEPRPLTIVCAPPAFPAGTAYDALDARDVLPPLLHPTVLMDAQAYDAWERMLVGGLARTDLPVEQALARAARLVEAVRGWRPGAESLTVRLRTAGQVAWETAAPAAWAPAADWHARVRRAVPGGLATPAAPPDVERALARWVDPAWRSFDAVVSRYVAAHAFASWTAYQGHGLRAVWRSVASALMVLRVEAARQARAAGRVLDAPLLLEAIRQSDLLLRHLCDRQGLADQWNALEQGPVSD